MAHFKEEELFYPSTWRHLQIMIKILSKLKSNFIPKLFCQFRLFFYFFISIKKNSSTESQNVYVNVLLGSFLLSTCFACYAALIPTYIH